MKQEADDSQKPAPAGKAVSPRCIEVAAGLIFRGGTLLITQRPPGTHLAGLWEFPGGKRELQETFAECLRRELQEELGVEIEVGALIEALTHEYPGRTVHLEFYRCILRAGEPQPLGCAGLRWITRAELDTIPFPDADARLIGKLRAQPELWSDS